MALHSPGLMLSHPARVCRGATAAVVMQLGWRWLGAGLGLDGPRRSRWEDLPLDGGWELRDREEASDMAGAAQRRGERGRRFGVCATIVSN